MDKEVFKEAIAGIASAKGVTEDAVLEALKASLEKAYLRELGGGDDGVVEATIDVEKGEITLCDVRKIVAEEDIEDDYLEVSVEAANEDADDLLDDLKAALDKKKSKKDKDDKKEIQRLIDLVIKEKKSIKIGGEYRHYCDLDSISRTMAVAIKSVFASNIASAERAALYEIYKDHIGEMITGVVERSSDRSATVLIGQTEVELTRREMIGDEFFKPGETIKVYLQEVRSSDASGKGQKGQQIMITRASEGFLKRLFEEEIHEIYDGTVVIKGIAREAGVRSKVAVMSTNDDVDPTGACIGPGGSRIQRVLANLGSARDKEKIDIISWSESPALYVADSLRPAHVIGVKLLSDEEAAASPSGRPGAVAVVADDAYSVALGRKGANARLADRLTGRSIKIMRLSEAQDLGLEYTPYETLLEEVEKEKALKERDLFAARSKNAASMRPADAPAAPVVPELSAEEEEEFGAEAASVGIISPVEKTPEEPVIASTSEPEPVPAPVTEKPVEVRTTTTLESLERDLASTPAPKHGEEGKGKGRPAKSKRPRQISEKEVARPAPVELPKEAMPIYSEEELAEIAREEAESASSDYLDDELLDEYGDDSYYDDK